MTAHVSFFLLNLSVYAIDRSIERSCMYYLGGGNFAISAGTFSLDGGSAARVLEAEAEAAISTAS